MSMMSEFKEFAVKGNVADMAVGVVMGAAFGKVVSSFLDNVMMPPFGLATGGVDFNDLRVVLKAASGEAKAVTLNYGAFITTLVEFTILAFAVFLMVKGINRLRRSRPEPPPVPAEKHCPECLLAIPVKARRCGHCSQPQPS